MLKGIWTKGDARRMINKRYITISSVFGLILTVFVCALLANYPQLHQRSIAYNMKLQEQKAQGISVLGFMKEENGLTKKEYESFPEGMQLRLTMPKGIDSNKVSWNSQPVDKTITLVMEGIDSDYFREFPMIGSSDHIEDIIFETIGGKGYISVELDQVYEPDIRFEQGYLYIGFVDPHKIYDYIVVVDAGHGGSAPGAIKQGIAEKDIDLAIVLALKEIFDTTEDHIGVYYTRLDDSNPSFAKRVGLANDLKADLFLSVHNNSTNSGRMSSVRGTQVMYHTTDKGASYEFATICLNTLTQKLGSVDKGLVVGDDIYIINHCQVPVALAEVGFMTNREELQLLNSMEYQKLCGQALYEAITITLEEQNE